MTRTPELRRVPLAHPPGFWQWRCIPCLRLYFGCRVGSLTAYSGRHGA